MFDAITKFQNLIEEVKPKGIAEHEARRRLKDLRIVAAQPQFESLETDTIIYSDAAGAYFRVDRRRR